MTNRSVLQEAFSRSTIRSVELRQRRDKIANETSITNEANRVLRISKPIYRPLYVCSLTASSCDLVYWSSAKILEVISQPKYSNTKGQAVIKRQLNKLTTHPSNRRINHLYTGLILVKPIDVLTSHVNSIFNEWCLYTLITLIFSGYHEGVYVHRMSNKSRLTRPRWQWKVRSPLNLWLLLHLSSKWKRIFHWNPGLVPFKFSASHSMLFPRNWNLT